MSGPQHGGSLIEALAALALAGSITAGWVHGLRSEMRAVEEVRIRFEELTLARNLLANVAAAGCGPQLECPRDANCGILREALPPEYGSEPALERVEVSVALLPASARATTLSTLVRSGGRCG